MRVHRHVASPVNGVCCSCGFSGDEETVCPARADAVHCDHWWEGPDGDASPGPDRPEKG